MFRFWRSRVIVHRRFTDKGKTAVFPILFETCLPDGSTAQRTVADSAIGISVDELD